MGSREYDIERYLKGEMAPEEMHALEREALNDPFLADALEGAQQTGAEHFFMDLYDLRRSMHDRSGKQRPKIISLWQWSLGIAAGLIVISIASVYIIADLVKPQAPAVALSEKEIMGLMPRSTDTLEIYAPKPAVMPQEGQRPSGGRQRPSQALQELTPVAQLAPVEPRQYEVEVDLSEVPYDVMRPQAGGISRDTVTTFKRIVRGRVVSDEDGTGIPGVNVFAKGTAFGTMTNAEGQFELAIADESSSQLVFSSLGYRTEERAIATAHPIDVVLETDMAQLSEVVVTGESSASFKTAEPAGGKENYEKYLEESLRYPEQAITLKVEGKVTVQFTVTTSGSLSDFRIIKGLGYGCDEELIRLIKEGPKWSPSRKGSQPVSDKVKVRMKFRLPE